MPDVTPRVGIIVVNYNSAAFIDEFCASLKAIDYPAWRLIVVDSGSSDGSMTAIESSFAGCADFKAVRCPDNIGFAAGANLPFDGGLLDGCEFVLFLNNDTVLTRDFLTRMVESADEKMIVVPKILYTDDHRLISTHAGGFDWRLGVFRHTFAGRTDGPATSVRRDDLATASFCCALVPVQAFRDAASANRSGGGGSRSRARRGLVAGRARAAGDSQDGAAKPAGAHGRSRRARAARLGDGTRAR